MKFCIKARYVADSLFGIVATGGYALEFETKSQAQQWGRENLKLSSYVACWEVISKSEAKRFSEAKFKPE